MWMRGIQAGSIGFRDDEGQILLQAPSESVNTGIMRLVQVLRFRFSLQLGVPASDVELRRTASHDLPILNSAGDECSSSEGKVVFDFSVLSHVQLSCACKSMPALPNRLRGIQSLLFGSIARSLRTSVLRVRHRFSCAWSISIQRFDQPTDQQLQFSHPARRLRLGAPYQ